MIAGTTSTVSINEVHFDPVADISGDANGDGTRSASADEFVEIVNTTGAAIDISGWTLSDDDGDDFVFPMGTILGAGQAAVLFGGGTPAGNVGDGQPNSNFGGALVFVDDGTIGSGLSNAGDLIELKDGSGTLIDSLGYNNAGDVSGGSDQSITRDPDITGDFADHSDIAAANGALFSPGTQVDGSAFEAPVTILFEESFETDGNGSRYETSVAESSDGFGDFITRSDGSNIGSFVSYLEPADDFFFAVMDADSAPIVSQSPTLTFSDIDISGQSDLFFSIDVAEDQSSDGSEDWDGDSALIIEYSIDGGTFQNLLAFEAEGGTNTEPAQDTNFDGIGDGANLTDTFQTFSAAIAGTGSSLDIRVTFANLTSGDEDVAIDNLVLSNGELAPPPPPPPSFPEFSVGDAEVIEGDSGTTILQFTVELSQPSPAGGATVDYTIANGTAEAGSDFTAVGTPTLAFVEGETSMTVDVIIAGDTDIEMDETLTINLSNPTGTDVTIAEGSATGTILNDDFPPQGPAEVFVNEVHYDNSGGDVGEAVEIAGPAGTDLAGWSLALYNGNGGGVYNTIALSGTIPDQDDGFGTLSFATTGIQNGPDGFALVKPDGSVVQFLSYEGSFTATNGPAAGQTSEDIGVSEVGVPEGTSLQLGGRGFVYDDFTWQTSQTDTFDAVNTGQDFRPANPNGVFYVSDASVVEGDSGTTDITFNVFRVGGSAGEVSVDSTFSFGPTAPGNADPGDFTGINGGIISFADGETFQSFTLTVQGDTESEPNETFFFELFIPTGGATIGDGVGEGTILNDDAFNLLIGEIQGDGATSIFEGNEVSTSGIVTATSSIGFYLQDAGDGDTSTSDGIFVFTGDAPVVVAGDAIDVTGTVSEFRGGGDPANLSTTQLTDAAILVVSSGNDLPDAVVIGPNGIAPPTESITDGIDFYESLEGMLVTIENPVAVDSTNGFGELYTVASDGSGGLLASNVSDEGLVVIQGGEGGLGEFDAGAGSDFNPERIQIEDAQLNGFDEATPDVTPGTLLNSVTGVIDYGFENYELRPTAPVTVAAASTNLPETTTLVQGAVNQLSVATYNVLNLDINDADGDDDVANGRFAQVATDIAVNLGTPDIVVLQEIQDDSGSVNDGTTSALVTLEALATEIFNQTGIQYQVLDNPFVVDGDTGGQPGGNIRVAMLFNPDRVTLDEASVFTVTDPNSGELDAAFQGGRAPLGANFTFNGETVTVIGNHFRSKIGSDSSFSAIQPPTNAGALSRAAQAAAVNSAVDDLLQADPDANVVVVGDFNEFQFEEPMEVLTGELDFDGATVSEGSDVALVNLTNDLAPNDQFSVLFQGNAQALDHILATQNIAASAQIDAVHTNTPVGNPGSDHDPFLAVFDIGLRFTDGTPGPDLLEGDEGKDFLRGNKGNDTLIGNGGDDVLNGNEGNDRLEGGEGDDTLNGGNQRDELFGGDGEDILNGGNGGDRLDGGDNNDVLNGDGGRDFLLGGLGDDTLDGGSGTDRLNGQEGADSLTGGAGRDLFVLNADGAVEDADTVTDFTASFDAIQILEADGKAIVFDQAGADTLITADGVLIATIENADALDVFDNTSFITPPASATVGSAMPQSSSILAIAEPDDTWADVFVFANTDLAPITAASTKGGAAQPSGDKMSIAAYSDKALADAYLDPSDDPWVEVGMINFDPLL